MEESGSFNIQTGITVKRLHISCCHRRQRCQCGVVFVDSGRRPSSVLDIGPIMGKRCIWDRLVELFVRVPDYRISDKKLTWKPSAVCGNEQ